MREWAKGGSALFAASGSLIPMFPILLACGVFLDHPGPRLQIFRSQKNLHAIWHIFRIDATNMAAMAAGVARPWSSSSSYPYVRLYPGKFFRHLGHLSKGCCWQLHVSPGNRAELKRVLRAHFDGRPISILDLGCGDAAALAPLLKGLALQRYRGPDLSETALALAAENLKALPCPAELTHGHILAALAEDSSYDVIYSSFALHHLPAAQKAEFFSLATKRLNKEQGRLIAAC